MAKQKKTRRKMTGFGLLVILVVVLCGVVTYASAQVRKDRDDKLARQQELQVQIAEQKEQSAKLDMKRDYANTKKFIEEMARRVLGLVYPDEILFEEKSGGTGNAVIE